MDMNDQLVEMTDSDGNIALAIPGTESYDNMKLAGFVGPGDAPAAPVEETPPPAKTAL